MPAERVPGCSALAGAPQNRPGSCVAPGRGCGASSGLGDAAGDFGVWLLLGKIWGPHSTAVFSSQPLGFGSPLAFSFPPQLPPHKSRTRSPAGTWGVPLGLARGRGGRGCPHTCAQPARGAHAGFWDCHSPGISMWDVKGLVCRETSARPRQPVWDGVSLRAFPSRVGGVPKGARTHPHVPQVSLSVAKGRHLPWPDQEAGRRHQDPTWVASPSPGRDTPRGCGLV